MRRTSLLLLSAAALFIGTAVGAQERESVAITSFIVYPEVTSLKVGYHVDTHLKADCAASFDTGDGNGEWGYSNATIVEGELPPGLSFDQQIGKFSGTPEQPGRWELKVKFDGLYCYSKDNKQVDMARSAPSDMSYEFTFTVAQ
jgi:hypothetical protein